MVAPQILHHAISDDELYKLQKDNNDADNFANFLDVTQGLFWLTIMFLKINVNFHIFWSYAPLDSIWYFDGK